MCIENCLLMHLNTAKLVTISTNYHYITQLLLLTIIVSSKTVICFDRRLAVGFLNILYHTHSSFKQTRIQGVINSDVQYIYRVNLPYRDYDMSFSYIDISPQNNLTNLHV